MKKAILSLLLLGVALGSPVILVTDINTPDMFAAIAAGRYQGIPVIPLHNGELDDNIINMINNSDEVILVGGYKVISEDVENQLKEMGFNVTRLWGIERTQTALSVMNYFWNDPSCLVLVEDTFNPDRDTLYQEKALSIATRYDCPLITLPYGDISADLLETINDLNISRIFYLGSIIPNETKELLDNYNTTIITGNIQQIRKRVINSIGQTGMLIIAAPNWNETLGIGGAFLNRTYVERISKIEELDPVIEEIQANNISPIRIVGDPVLGEEIYNKLAENGINATLTTGNHVEVAKKLLEKYRYTFEERLREIQKIKAKLMEKIRERTLKLLNNTRNKLLELKISAEELNNTEIKEKVNEFEELINNMTNIINNNPENAKRILIKKLNDVKEIIVKRLNTTAIRERVNYKIVPISKIPINISRVKAQIRNQCANEKEINELIEKAKSLEVKLNASNSIVERSILRERIRKLLSYAEKLGKLCQRPQGITQNIKDLTKKAGERVSIVKVMKKFK